MGFFSDLAKSVTDALGITKKTKQVGSVIVKPDEVSKVSKGTSYSVPATGESGVKGVSKTYGTPKTSTNLVSTGNIQTELAKTGGNYALTIPKTTVPSTTVRRAGTGAALDTGATIGTNGGTDIRRGNTLTDAELAKIPINERPRAINTLTGQEMMAPQITEEEASPTSAYSLGQAGQAIGAAVGGTAIMTLLSSAGATFTAISNYFTSLGAKASTVAGAKAIASNIPEAAGVATATNVGGQIATNTATTATKIGFLASIMKSKLALGMLIGGVPSVATLISSGAGGATEVRKSASTYIKDANEMILLFEQAGMEQEADQLHQNMLDIQDDFETVIPYIPWLGKTIETNKIQSYVDEMNSINLQYERRKIEKASQEAANELAWDRDPTNYYGHNYLGSGLTGADYDKKEKEKQALIEQEAAQEDATQAEEEAAAKDQDPNNYYGHNYLGSGLTGADYDARIAAGITNESVPGSTLGFGLLSTGGDTVLVNKNTTTLKGTYITDPEEISMYYFGVAYAQLNDVQKQLVDTIAG